MINLIQTRRRVMKMMMLVALVVPILAACNSNAAEKEADMGTVVYALKDIDRMALIAPADLEERQMPKDKIPENAASSASLLAGSYSAGIRKGYMISVQAQSIGAPPWKVTVQCVNRDIPAGYSINKKKDFGTKEIDAGPVEWAKKPLFRDDFQMFAGKDLKKGDIPEYFDFDDPKVFYAVKDIPASVPFDPSFVRVEKMDSKKIPKGAMTTVDATLMCSRVAHPIKAEKMLFARDFRLETEAERKQH